MVRIEFKIGGDQLAKVFHYYGIPSDQEKIVCPFHSDINPSMKINYATGNYFCFGCQEKGDAFSFVKKIEHIDDDLQGMKKLVTVLKSNKVKKIKAMAVNVNKSDAKQALIEATDHYYGLKTIDWLKEKSPEHEYMKARGFSSSTLTHCKAKYTYNQQYPLIFPMMDNDEFKGWVCRTTTKSVEKKRKYLYNEGFSRRSTLCGKYTRNQLVVIVEGYMDMLKFRQFGIKNVVAILGWKITAEQVNKLKEKGITCVISALDMDECGRKGTTYLKQFFEVINFQYSNTVKDAGEMNKDQFIVAQAKTKKLIKNRRSQDGISRRH